jgi:hypothetical protein
MKLNLPSKSTGTVSAAQYNQLLACVEQLAGAVSGQLKVGPGLQMQQGASDTVLSVSPGLVGDTSFWAEITGATADGDRWKYSWQEVIKTSDGYTTAWATPATGGRTGSANAYNGDELATDDYDAVPTGSIIRLRKVAKAEGMAGDEYWFCSNEDTGGTGTATGFWAIVTPGSIDANGRYPYSFNEAEKTSATGYAGWQAKSGGTSGTAYNGAEVPDPTSTARWRPVPADSVVWIEPVTLTIGGTNYYFNESSNQDTNFALISATPTALGFTAATRDEDLWNLTANAGSGSAVKFFTDIYWDTTDGKLKGRTRTLQWDDGGRVINCTIESAAIDLVTGRECPA